MMCYIGCTHRKIKQPLKLLLLLSRLTSVFLLTTMLEESEHSKSTPMPMSSHLSRRSFRTSNHETGGLLAGVFCEPWELFLM